jgi:hypothetical protein
VENDGINLDTAVLFESFSSTVRQYDFRRGYSYESAYII